MSVLLHKESTFCFTVVFCVLCEFCESVLALECCKFQGKFQGVVGLGEGRVPSFKTSAVERDEYKLMFRPWGIQGVVNRAL